MHIEIPLERFVDFYRLVTLGKLIQGLVHNLNGPLQNLGMDMEMMEHTLKHESEMPHGLSDSFLGRLDRMEREFDHISRLIKSAAMRIDPEGDFLEYGTLKSFLEQEISFLHANLYFKHNVEKDIQLPADLPRLDLFTRDLLLSISWLVQCFIEPMETGEAKRFIMKGSTLSSAVEISLLVEGTMVGKCYADAVAGETVPSEPLKIQNALEMSVPLALLRLYGGSALLKREQERVEMTLQIPLRRM
ncbi:MAG: hypothetical protein C4576_27920 [Desulfobacteraceae bacterium]|nr:MAG: hypothetical protein C4576_27920 [Desulfobacteraceae bacterium]